MRVDSKIESAEDAQVDPEACWKLLERVAASPHLNRAPRLREFLFYVGNKSLKGEISEVHEQEIGSVVFGRQPHYDTSQDNIVRVNATELRKRIDAYFISDGATETWGFQIPRGGYKPVFRRRVPPAKAPEVAETVPVVVPAEIKAVEASAPATPVAVPTRLPLFLALGVAAALGCVCLFLWGQNHSLRMALVPWRSHPALSAFWSGFLDSNQETDIVLADTSFALVQDISGKSYPLHDYLDNAYLGQLQSAEFSVDRRADLSQIASRLNGSIGDFGVAERIKSLDPSSSQLFVKYAREYTADSMKRDNTILIGSQKSNPWVDLFADQMNFQIQFHPPAGQTVVKNLNPRAGEQAEYTVPIGPDASVGYSIIAYLPNPSRTTKSMIIEGTNSQATDAAGEFVASEDAMEGFRKHFPSSRFSFFEILLKTTHLNGTPFKAEIVTYRIY